MDITLIGTGYVGLTTACCLADLGHRVLCLDWDLAKIDNLRKGVISFYEPGLQDLFQRNLTRLRFEGDYPKELPPIRFLINTVGTPSDPLTGSPNLSGLYQSLSHIIPHLDPIAIILLKSTIPVGITRSLISKLSPQLQTPENQLYFQPEFLAEGSAIRDVMFPHRIVLGCHQELGEVPDFLFDLYPFLKDQNIPILTTTYETAELTKYAANGLLASRLAFINEMAGLCERTGGNIETLSKAVGLDPRIGPFFLKAGPGFGGSCFPKDLKALDHLYDKHSIPGYLPKAILTSNTHRQHHLADRIIHALHAPGDSSPSPKTIGVFGLTFKAGTDDLRDAPSLSILPYLHEAGLILKAYDPTHPPQNHFPYASLVSNAWEAIENTDALLILTEWPEFLTLDLKKVRDKMSHPFIIDYRNLFNPRKLQALGFKTMGVGMS